MVKPFLVFKVWKWKLFDTKTGKKEVKMKINRAVYKKIKKYDRTEMDDFLSQVYVNGYKAGELSSKKFNVLDLLIKVLPDVDGIGEKRMNQILLAVQEELREDANER